MSEKFCPNTFCPLVAKNGSPWTGPEKSPCPGHDDLEDGGCPWWSMGCGGNGMVHVVDEVEREGAFVIGPNKPRRPPGRVLSYDCPHAHECRWQEQSQTGLCAPREAMKRGLDPRVVLF